MSSQNSKPRKTESLRIGMDARMISHSGIGMRIRGILKFLGQEAAKHGVYVYLFGDLATIQAEGISCRPFSGFEEISEIETKSKGRSVKTEEYSYPVISYTTPIYSPKEFLGHPMMKRMDLLDIPHFNAPLRYLSKCIVTIHDIIPFRMREFHSAVSKRIYMQVVFRLIRRFAKKIVSVSEFTAEDLKTVFDFTGEKIRVVHNAIDDSVFYPATSSEKKKFLKKYKLQEGYLLSVGIGKGHKNLNLVLRALASVAAGKKNSIKWVLGGASGKIPEYLRKDAENFQGEIRPMPRLNLDELRCLYSCAGLLVFPSKYEGFGFPPLEAQACGCPVISSNATVMPEILGNSTFYFSPDHTDQLETLLRKLTSEGRNSEFKKLISKGKKNVLRFSWKKSAKEILEIYLT
ncbi:glycosyltransferase family 1 protein [Leptospira gomenensis]|uniref:Glycosyltransferase family 1 protein n=1 Tax=Leptospira gomenensis TaxID=2484974 RepID=A0A5F1Y5E1_9LEPT|nr:glycosyltransferase family 1 protein [Leptospira gomenensis]TGK27931.1 glycosyltransferase family 1 protein [Leptospira gomenensis]TGK45463.1 glycosyltransferase family 1 protein [Leptospira gomenensis]TGK45850.1 glycosyltransferase family 1 protein [Leptospira gomenensis]TGK65224.1 glycosyltransferase family 1 protein [Leptospira gomenensis]